MSLRPVPVFLAVLALCLAAVPAARAAEPGGVSIAVVDVQKLMTDSTAAKSLQGQMDSQRKSFQDEFSRYERELHDSEKTLTAERDKLSADDYTKKREAFEEKLLETRRLVQKRKGALDEAFNKALGQLQEAIIKISAKIADEKGYQLVITRQNVVVVEKSLDITQAVMDRLNKELADVKLKVESNQG